MFPFDVILFDVGGVLLTNGWDTSERARAAEHFHLDLAGLEARHHAADGAWEIGAISADVASFAAWRAWNPERACCIEEVHGGRAEQRSARDQRVSL